MEILIASVLVIVACILIYKNVKKAKNGECNCGSCSSTCPKYKKKDK